MTTDVAPISSIVCPCDAEIAAEKAANNTQMNRIDAIFSELDQVDCPLVHTITNGLYSRQITMPKDTFVTSKIHKTEHQFIISKGDVSVYCEGEGVKRFKAPYLGITSPGARRILFMHEDTVWTTFHPTTETNLEKIEEQLIYKHNHKTLE